MFWNQNNGENIYRSIQCILQNEKEILIGKIQIKIYVDLTLAFSHFELPL